MDALSARQVTLIRAAELVASPWKNGGGVTREIAAHSVAALSAERPAGAALDTFAWRVSVADVAQPGPFSRFDGVDRTLVLLSGAGMTLVEDGGARHALRAPLERIDFAGETALRAELHDGPTRDFNLMTRRAVVQGAVTVWRAGETHTLCAHTALLFCVSGTPAVAIDGAASMTLNAFDTVRIDAIGSDLRCSVSGAGTLLAISLTTPNHSGIA